MPRGAARSREPYFVLIHVGEDCEHGEREALVLDASEHRGKLKEPSGAPPRR